MSKRIFVFRFLLFSLGVLIPLIYFAIVIEGWIEELTYVWSGQFPSFFLSFELVLSHPPSQLSTEFPLYLEYV